MRQGGRRLTITCSVARCAGLRWISLAERAQFNAPADVVVMLEPEAAWLASPREASPALPWQVDLAGERRHNEQAGSAVDRIHGAACIRDRA
jgi:hypothetical protein